MTARPTPPLNAFVPAALAASRVGVWEYDVLADAFRYDASMAALYGLGADEGERGVPIAHFRRAIHPEDLPRHFAQCREVFRDGGMFVIEYRTCPRDGEVRWVMVRGRYEANAQGQVVVGRGIAIDLTESKQDGYAEGQALFLSVDPSPGFSEPELLDAVAHHALQVRRLVDQINGLAGSLLRPLVDALLYGVGRRIAARFDGPGDVEDEQADRPERMH